MFYYGMRLRGYSIGCQPQGAEVGDGAGRYYNILGYKSPLSDNDLYNYDLDQLKCDSCVHWKEERCTNPFSCFRGDITENGCFDWEDFPF